MEAIKITNLTKCYKDVKALDGIDLAVEEGELFGLLGVNGAGKTTLIKILCGLAKKTSGKALVDGKDTDSEMNLIKEIVDVSPQETSVAPNLTVLENLRFFAEIYRKDTKEFIDDIVKTFKLEEVSGKKARTLSGGYQRRLSIACALVSEPKILFLDEPTLGLDVLARRELWKIITGLKGRITIILTSHYLEEIEALCDRVAIMSKGHILKIGKTEEIKRETGSDNFESAFIKIVEEEQQ